jgi:hypothetical protein
MKKIGYLGLLLLLASFHTEEAVPQYRHTANESFGVGEHLVYNVRYGWLDAGQATMRIDEEVHEVNGRSCYKIDITGESKGLLYLFLKMKNHFCTYLDTTALVSQHFYRYIQEGKYRKNEKINFDHAKKLAVVERLDDHTRAPLDTVAFSVSDDIQDIASSWYTLRTLDFSQAQAGDIFSTAVFFDDILYKEFKIRFLGRKILKTKLGTFNVLVLAPVVPFASDGNSIFDGENSVELFLSEDENKIPLKVKIKLLVGAIEIDLTKYQGLKHELKRK